MVEPVINATVREHRGKSAAGALRRNGRVPGIVYGPGKENLPIHLGQRELEHLFTSGHASGLISLVLSEDGRESRRKVLIKDIQRDYLKGGVKHLDLLEVAMDHPVTTSIPILVHGEEHRRGNVGVVQHVLHALEVSCLPADIPEHVTVDVTNLEIGHSIHVGDLQLPPRVKALAPPEDVVATMVAPTRERVEEKLGEEEAEPAVVGKGKAEEKEAKEE